MLVGRMWSRRKGGRRGTTGRGSAETRSITPTSSRSSPTRNACTDLSAQLSTSDPVCTQRYAMYSVCQYSECIFSPCQDGSRAEGDGRRAGRGAGRVWFCLCRREGFIYERSPSCQSALSPLFLVLDTDTRKDG